MMFNARRLKMNRSAFSAFVVIAAIAGSFQNANGQAGNATMQTGAPRAVAKRSAPATAAKPVAPGLIARPTGLPPKPLTRIRLARLRNRQLICSALILRLSGA